MDYHEDRVHAHLGVHLTNSVLNELLLGTLLNKAPERHKDKEDVVLIPKGLQNNR